MGYIEGVGVRFLKLTVFTALSVCLVFTVVVLVVSCRGISVPDVLIQYFFITFGVELAATAAIKIAENALKKKEVDDRITSLKENNITPERADFKAEESYDYYDGGNTYG